MEWIETIRLNEDEDGGQYDDTIHKLQNSSFSTGEDDIANPNDNAHTYPVLLGGSGPGRRSGHTCSIVHRKLFIFGGSLGSEYLNDIYVLDTDPPPTAAVTNVSSTALLQHSLTHFVNDAEYSDVTFIVEERRIFGHKIILSLLSERFRGMFSSGFREASQREIVIEDIRYSVFLKMIEYLYTGSVPELKRIPLEEASEEANRLFVHELHLLVDLLSAADQFLIDHLKQLCEATLQLVVVEDTVDFLLEASDRHNAVQLKAVCMHFIRNDRELHN